MQTNRLHILFIAFLALISSANSFSQVKDSIANTMVNDSIVSIDSIAPVKKKEAIDFVINHTAEGYIYEDVLNKKTTLYDLAHVVYGENDITAGIMIIDKNTNLVTAKGIPDEDGKYSQLPVFKTTGNESTQDSLIFNYKTKKAIIYGLETTQDGINTLGEKTKRVNDSTIFVRNIVFTTSDPRNPDYYIRTNKAKVIPGKKIITGFSNLVIADVPTPAIFPFAYFPMTKKKTSGIIFPTYGESSSQGFFLQNGGYYLALSDYYDLKLTGDIYSNSSWGFNAASRYKVRYKFSGNVSFNYDKLISGVQGFDDYSISKNFNVRWSHSQDTKSSPNHRFSASVNLGSSQYFRQSINETNTGQSLNNTLSSSISFYKKFEGTPFNITLSANHSQNTNTEIVSATLPSFQLNMDRLNPFAPKNGTAKNALQKIGFNYSFKANNSVSTTEDKFFSGQIFKDAKNGAQHTAGLSTSMKVLKYLTLSPSVSYRETWHTKKLEKTYDADTEEVVTDTISGFSAYRTFSTSAGLSTNIYGMYNFKSKKIKAIRHVMTPSVSYSYTPDFSFYNDEVQSDAEGTIDEFLPSYGSINPSIPSTVSNSLSFSLSNSLEAKVLDKDSVDGEYKKINLLNSLNISSGYNFTAESFKLSTFSLSTGTTLFKKLNLNFSATLDPYHFQDGEKFDKLSIKNGGPLFTVTSGRFSTGYSFSSKDKDAKKNGEKEEEYTAYDQDMFNQNQPNSNDFQHQEADENKEKEEKKDIPLYLSSMPWNIRFGLSTTYSNSDGTGLEPSNNSLTVSGDIELSPGWKVGVSSGYDFVNKGITYTNLRFTRDLSSWSMNFNWTPLGNNSSYYFFIGVKSSVLSDLKWDKTNVNTSL